MKKSMLKYRRLILLLFCVLFLSGCGSDAKKADHEELSVPAVAESAASQKEQEKEIYVPEERTEEEPAATEEPVENSEVAEYGHEDIYMSIEIPSGWNYMIKTTEEMEKEDGLALCAIEFWQEDYPETVFTLSYETFFGICGTGVTIDDFTLENGINGCCYTEEIEDTLWLNMVFSNPANYAEEGIYKGGTYCIMASPKLSEWDVIEPEFEEIVESIWVGSH